MPVCTSRHESVVLVGEKEQLSSFGMSRVLEKLDSSHTVELLIAALKDEDAEVREQVAKVLGKLGDLRAIGPLLAALIDENTWVQRQAVWALVTLGASAVEPLLATLKDENATVRIRAVEALRYLGDLRAVEPLLTTLTGSRATPHFCAREVQHFGETCDESVRVAHQMRWFFTEHDSLLMDQDN